MATATTTSLRRQRGGDMSICDGLGPVEGPVKTIENCNSDDILEEMPGEENPATVDCLTSQSVWTSWWTPSSQAKQVKKTPRAWAVLGDHDLKLR